MSINEGQTIQYTVNTTKVTDGTVIYWQLTGNTAASQTLNSNGSITIVNNKAVFNVTTIAITIAI